MRRLILPFLAAALAAGCVTVGHPLPSDIVEHLVIGQTTRAEIEERLGPPFRTGVDSGLATANYVYYRVGLFNRPVTTDLTVTYTGDQKVKAYTYNSNQGAGSEPGGE